MYKKITLNSLSELFFAKGLTGANEISTRKENYP
jgi:hypothetical protein